MFYLFWDSEDFGKRFKRAGQPEVKAKYSDLESAIAQAKHDLEVGRHPLRVENEEGLVLWDSSEEE